MKYTKYIAIAFVLVALLIIGAMIKQPAPFKHSRGQAESAEHIYTSWDIMEFDKCVAGWLIVRFIDKNAKFVFYPQGSEINEGILFDVPGADWSRKHLQCTSQCVLEVIDNPDAAIEKIVTIASRTELNFWQLDRWPEAQKCFYKVKEIMDRNPEPSKCFEETFLYFDELYSNLKKDDAADSDN